MMIVISFVLGALAWTLLEYALHRGLGHKAGLKNPFTVEHLHHHKDVTYYAPTTKKVLSATVLTALLGPPLFIWIGAPAVSGILGFLVMYSAYEVVHRQLHVSVGKTRYGRWARRHHLFHHFSRPKMNHGVTTPIWDYVFGTLDVPEVVKVPRKRALPWMLKESGELVDELAQDFVLVGRPKKQKVEPAEASAVPTDATLAAV